MAIFVLCDSRDGLSFGGVESRARREGSCSEETWLDVSLRRDYEARGCAKGQSDCVTGKRGAQDAQLGSGCHLIAVRMWILLSAREVLVA